MNKLTPDEMLSLASVLRKSVLEMKQSLVNGPWSENPEEYQKDFEMYRDIYYKVVQYIHDYHMNLTEQTEIEQLSTEELLDLTGFFSVVLCDMEDELEKLVDDTFEKDTYREKYNDLQRLYIKIVGL